MLLKWSVRPRVKELIKTTEYPFNLFELQNTCKRRRSVLGDNYTRILELNVAEYSTDGRRLLLFSEKSQTTIIKSALAETAAHTSMSFYPNSQITTLRVQTVLS